MQGVNNLRPRQYYAVINVKWNWKKPFTSWRKPFLKHVNFDEINDSSEKALRYNKNKTKAIISMTSKPSFLKQDRMLSHEDIMDELQKSEWSR